MSGHLINKQYIFVFFCLLKFQTLFSQRDFRIGIKTHPNLSFSTVADKSTYDKDHFSLRNGAVGLNIGLTASFRKNKWLFECSDGLHSNKTGLNFKKNADYSRIKIRTISFTNGLTLGYRIYYSGKPYYEIFLTSNYSFSIVAIQKLSGESYFNNIEKYQAVFPDLNATWKSHNVGIGLKIRTQLKNLRRFDYGISYSYSMTNFSEIGMKIKIQDVTYESYVKPKLQTLNFDFIYYFGRKKPTATLLFR
jgi:hypothetical protein